MFPLICSLSKSQHFSLLFFPSQGIFVLVRLFGAKGAPSRQRRIAPILRATFPDGTSYVRSLALRPGYEPECRRWAQLVNVAMGEGLKVNDLSVEMGLRNLAGWQEADVLNDPTIVGRFE